VGLYLLFSICRRSAQPIGIPQIAPWLITRGFCFFSLVTLSCMADFAAWIWE
jgi:hypothetical protein